MRTFLRRLRYALRRRRLEAELAEEMDFHRDRLQREMQAGGLPPDEAAAATRRALGSVPLAGEQARDVWIWPWAQDAAQDLRFAARLLAKERRFTLAVIVALGLGIGATNTVFTLVNTVMLRDMPFDRADQLVEISTQGTRGRRAGVSYADYKDWAEATRTFSSLSASTHAGGMTLADDRGAPERLRGQYVSANTFSMLRTRPLLGRDFLPDDERPGAPPVVIIGFHVWQGRYDGDPRVIGRTIRINDTPVTIIGVMPAGFAYSFTTEIWQPLSLWPGLDPTKRDARGLDVVGRIADASDRVRALADLEAIAAQLARAYPDTNKDITPVLHSLKEGFVRGTTPMLMTLMGAVTFVLLIACANVANLLLARSVARGREVAIRASLGATRWRIVRQLLIECLLLAVLAGIAGLVLSVYGVRFLGVAFQSWEIEAPAQAQVPYWVDLSMNATVFLFLSGVCLTTTLLFGLVPAWHVSRTNTNALLKEDGRGAIGSRPAQRLTSTFIVTEIALTLILLTGAGLLTRSFLKAYYADYVIDTSTLAVLRLSLPEHKYRTPEERARFFATLDARLASTSSLPSGPTGSAVIASAVPFAPFGASRQLTIDGRTPAAGTPPPSVSYVYASDRYFTTLGLPIVRGRALASEDAAPGREGAIVNERFAAMFFPDETPIGRRIRLATPAPPGASANATTEPSPWLTIVGISPTLPRLGPNRTPEPVVYVALGAEPAPGPFASLIVRGAGGLAAVTPPLREQVRALDPDLPLYSIELLDSAVARGWVSQRLFGGFLAMLAVTALVLAAVGLYAVTAHGVARRTQEIGIRMALGARAAQVIWLFARRTLVQLAIGLTLGLGGALAVGRLLQALLVDTTPRDAATLFAVSILLVSVAMAASYVPARRAARLSPVAALKDE